MNLPRKHLLPAQLSLFLALGTLCGCAADAARPGTVCGHCDYRFSHYTPNPCDPCEPEIELPGYGHTPSIWHVWPEALVHSHVEPGPHGVPIEEVPSPAPPSPPTPMPSTGGMFPSPRAPLDAMAMPDYDRPRPLLR